MGYGGIRALKVARLAGLLLMPVEARDLVRVCGGVLEVGFEASPDEVVTAVCRYAMSLAGIEGEDTVRAMVETHGFSYASALLRPGRRASIKAC
jgi:hypothetical protein